MNIFSKKAYARNQHRSLPKQRYNRNICGQLIFLNVSIMSNNWTQGSHKGSTAKKSQSGHLKHLAVACRTVLMVQTNYTFM